MERATVNGGEIEFRVIGSGEPVLMVSTGPIADSFFPLLEKEALASGHRLIAYRQRRRLFDSPAEAGRGFAQHASDAAALLGHLGIPSAHVAGHSTGAAIALQLAVDHPRLVNSLVLLEPPLLTAPAAPAFFQKLEPALAAYQSGDREGAMRKFLAVVCGLEWPACEQVIERNVPGGVEWALRNADAFFEGYLPALNGWEFGPEEAAAIRQPVLSIVGTRTEQLFLDGHQILHRWLPQLEELAIDGAGHLLHMENSEPVARGMGAFFARHRAPLGAAAARAGNE